MGANEPIPMTLTSVFNEKAGIQEGISHDDYHADRSCASSTTLKKLLRSPAHYQAHLKEARRPTKEMEFGSAFHALVLEPDVFRTQYVKRIDAHPSSHDYKMFLKENWDKTILSEDEFAVLEQMANNLRVNDTVCALLEEGLPEVTLVWQDEETGIWLKARPDLLCIDEGVNVDLKTTTDASEESFLYDCKSLHYDLSAAMYLDGLKAVFGRDFDFAFLAAEKSAPYANNLLAAPDGLIQRGQRLYRKALRVLAQCRETDTWPGYQPDGGYTVMHWPKNWT